ncbi:patched family domain-containing protein [Ditylenchus destructor]|nr:patched family domain-containing protein [Ditylenchus destructor]
MTTVYSMLFINLIYFSTIFLVQSANLHPPASHEKDSGSAELSQTFVDNNDMARDRPLPRCAMRDVCGQEGGMHQNCVYEGPPVPISFRQDQLYKELCPQLFTDHNIAVCCNHAQFEILRQQMTIPQQLLSRCPSCYSNFVNFWCQFACSPMQRNFVNVIEMKNGSDAIYDDEAYISRVQYYITPKYAHGLFESCKNVKTTNGDYVLSMLCGTNIENCTPQKLFKYLGTYNKAIQIPFTIDVIVSDANKQVGKRLMRPMNATVYKCNESSDISDHGCSCSDCTESCSATSVSFPILFEENCKMALMECSTAMGIIAVGVLCGTIMITIVLHYILQRYTAEEESIDYVKYHAKSKSKVKLEERLVLICASYGRFVTDHSKFVFFVGLIPALIASLGVYSLRLTTDPVELWSSPGSKAREQRDFFNKYLTPFYRAEQFIIVPRDQSSIEREDPKNFMRNVEYGPVFRESFLYEAFKLYDTVLSLTATLGNDTVALRDICFKPLAPENGNCMVLSIFNYFQNDEKLLHKIDDSTFTTYDYLDHLLDCLSNPYTMSSKLRLQCLGDFGGPIQPYVVLGDFKNSKYESSRGLVVTILVNNHLDAEKNEKAMAWEYAYIKFLRTIHNPTFTISFMAERSLQDEIKRQSTSDALTVVLSYVFMFVYVAFALGQYQVSSNQLCSLFINSKFLVGICGVFSVTLSVTSSIGLFALYDMPASLLILEVEPFLVLAVGVDNIFIFVQAYQRLSDQVDKPLQERISLICSEVMPSMLLSSLSECLCFLIGGMSEMPAVQAFSLYASLAIFLNFFLQVTVFLAVFVWDIRRQEEGRLEMCCCVQMRFETQNPESYMYKLFKKYYAPTLLRSSVRSSVVLIFALWLTSSVLVVNNIKAGLDQKMAVPEDSYVLDHFLNMDRFLSVGPVVYFVLRGPFDFGQDVQQKLICQSSIGCSPRSLGSQIATAAKFPDRSYIAHPAMNWVDDYVEWLRPIGAVPCCRQFVSNDSFCSPNVQAFNACVPCEVPFHSGRPKPESFHVFLSNFLSENPSKTCARAGHAAYGSAIRLSNDSSQVVASSYMTYHTVLKTSEDYIKAMESAILIAQNATRMINTVLKDLNQPEIEVFPYSIFYVFYEQYQGIVRAAIIQILLSLASIFCVTTVLLGMDPWSAFVIVTVIALILMNVIGLMYWWSIDFNAISVVNLVMSVGISVEFCAHIVRAFTLSAEKTRVERASDALSNVGCSVLSGITLTKLGGIVVLAFAHSQIFNVYYFRMFLGIVVIGAAHGLILLPVLLSLCGPPVSRRRLYLKAMEQANHPLEKHAFLDETPAAFYSEQPNGEAKR